MVSLQLLSVDAIDTCPLILKTIGIKQGVAPGCTLSPTLIYSKSVVHETEKCLQLGVIFSENINCTLAGLCFGDNHVGIVRTGSGCGMVKAFLF